MRADHPSHPIIQPGRLRAVSTIMGIAVIINLWQFGAIDAERRHNYAAINTYYSGDLFEVGVRTSASTRISYGVYLALSQIAPDSTVTIINPGQPDDNELTNERTVRVIQELAPMLLRTFGKAATVTVVRPNDPVLARESLSSLDLVPFIVATDEADSSEHWLIAVEPSDPAVGNPERPDRYLREALFYGNRGSTSHPAREFWAIEWRHPDDSPEAAPRIALVEVTLIPQHIRAEVLR